jgi:hypothetical protein
MFASGELFASLLIVLVGVGMLVAVARGVGLLAAEFVGVGIALTRIVGVGFMLIECVGVGIVFIGFIGVGTVLTEFWGVGTMFTEVGVGIVLIEFGAPVFAAIGRGLDWLRAVVVLVFAVGVIRGAVDLVYLGGVRSLVIVDLVTLAGLPGGGIEACFCFLFAAHTPGTIGNSYKEKQSFHQTMKCLSYELT